MFMFAKCYVNYSPSLNVYEYIDFGCYFPMYSDVRFSDHRQDDNSVGLPRTNQLSVKDYSTCPKYSYSSLYVSRLSFICIKNESTLSIVMSLEETTSYNPLYHITSKYFSTNSTLNHITLTKGSKLRHSLQHIWYDLAKNDNARFANDPDAALVRRFRLPHPNRANNLAVVSSKV